MHDEPAAKSGFPWKKVLLGCGCASLLSVALCLGVGWYVISNSYTLDPVQVAATADTILPGATLPAGYDGAVAVDFMGFKMAMLSREKFQEGQPLAGMACMLMQIPTANAAQAQAQMQTQLSQQTGQQGTTREDLESETVKVGDSETELFKTRVTGNGQTQVQMMVLLPRGASTVLAMFIGPEATFDRDALDAFLASIPAPAK